MLFSMSQLKIQAAGSIAMVMPESAWFGFKSSSLASNVWGSDRDEAKKISSLSSAETDESGPFRGREVHTATMKPTSQKCIVEVL